MKTFEKTSLIPNCSIDELFDFHLDVNNLKAITPKDTKVELLNKDFVPTEGGILKLKTIKNFLSTTWEVKIEKLKKPEILIDVAIKSPFEYWEHSHIFTQRGNVCQLKDVVKYELPLGKFGELFNLFIEGELKKMFDFRHDVTKTIITKNKTQLAKNSVI